MLEVIVAISSTISTFTGYVVWTFIIAFAIVTLLDVVAERFER